jgi:hypothetical protein
MGLFRRKRKSNDNNPLYGKNYPQLWKSAVQRNDSNSEKIFTEWMAQPAAKTDTNAILAQIILQSAKKHPESDISFLINLVKKSKPSDEASLLFYAQEAAGCLYSMGYEDIAGDLRPALDIAVGGIDNYL